VLLALLAAATFLPGAVCDPRLVEMDPLPDVYLGSAALVLASIIPMCAVLGYLTPDLIDTYSAGHPRLAGRAYAINVLGCILGPLVACYGLLPWMSERWALMILSLPYLLFAVPGLKSLHARWRLIAASGMGALAVYSLFFSQDYEDQMARPSRKTEVRRDYAASVISTDPPSGKTLLVNGIGMTKLTPITKFMVHLPLTAHLGRPQSALIICFGMGTSYRSALSWNLDVTAVELVPSVIKAFGFYHADAPQILNNPRGRLVIDDGRRFLARDRETFDLIVIDPPPPVEAAGSSLLYSTEFYALARQHLKPHGILQAWFPGGERLTTQAVVRSLCDSFPHVRCFFSVEGWGIHMLASMDPIEVPPPEQWAERMPAGARRDLLEWCVRQDLPDYARRVVTNEIPVADILNPNPRVRITDDDPLNEYFLLRQAGLF
jgi:spermidine synthase